MEEYIKATGKEYDRDKYIICNDCKEIYSSKLNCCPNCNSNNSKFFQRTVSSIKQEEKIYHG